MSRHAQPAPLCACAQPAHGPLRPPIRVSAVAQRWMPAHLQLRQPAVSNMERRSIWKMLGPFATASRRTPPVLHCHSPGVATVACRLRITPCSCQCYRWVKLDVHDDDDDNNDNAWQRGPLWPHGMGPRTYVVANTLSVTFNLSWIVSRLFVVQVIVGFHCTTSTQSLSRVPTCSATSPLSHVTSPLSHVIPDLRCPASFRSHTVASCCSRIIRGYYLPPVHFEPANYHNLYSPVWKHTGSNENKQKKQFN